MTARAAAIRILPFAYFLAVSLPHHPFSRFLDEDIIIPLGYQTIQSAADVASILALLGVLALGISVFRLQGTRSLYHLVFWSGLLFLMCLADRYLIVNNIERIHFPQYAVLSLLLGLSLQNEILIFFTSSFGGFIDEFLQFVMNPNKTNYLDFNDIVLNILGAAFGIAILLVLRKAVRREKTKYENQFGFFLVSILASVGVLAALAFVFDRVVILLEQVKDRSVFATVNGKLSFILSFERHDEFLQRSDFGKFFHVFSPLEGISAIAALSALTCLSINRLKSLRMRSAE